MANQEHLDLLKQGSSAWNAWRVQHKEVRPDLSFANLIQANLSFANLNGADLSGADLSGAILYEADLSQADLSQADLSRANLSRTLLVGTNLANTTLKDCSIYGISAWDVQLDGAEQLNLTITPYGQPIITVDNLKIAQFIYLLLNNKEIRDVINTLTTKSVLILGRFTPERKAILDALRDALRINNYLPILFDFEKPSHLDLTETVTTLAHLSRFTIIDLTEPRSAPNEAASLIPHCKVAIQPIIEGSSNPYAMFADFKLYPWVLNLYRYRD